MDLFKEIDIAVQVRRIKRNLESVIDKCTGPIEQTLITQASLVAAEQRSVAPVGEGADEKNPGALRDSIRVERGSPTAKKAIVIKIKAGGESTHNDGYDYARAQEFGTQEMPANPFFFPIWRARRKDVRAAVNKAIKNAVKDVFK